MCSGRGNGRGNGLGQTVKGCPSEPTEAERISPADHSGMPRKPEVEQDGQADWVRPICSADVSFEARREFPEADSARQIRYWVALGNPVPLPERF